ncbi:MAG: response regulator [Candidatus Competibacterales bacterium]|nr:response regulator [Candidatus Competibacterales bacterium]
MARILIVDDSPTETIAFRKMLSDRGHKIFTANNGEEGISMAREIKPDLILMDVVMPGLNGFQATRRLSKDPETADIPVIMVTSKDQETDRIWGMRQGAKEYVVKPPNPTDLMTKIEALLGGRV